MTVTVFSRPKCPLCDKAIAELAATGVPFNQVDITQDVYLEGEFGMFVPVVQVDGKTIFEAGMNPKDLAELVRQTLGG